MSDNRKPTPKKAELRALAASPAVRGAIFITLPEYAGILNLSMPSINRQLREGKIDVLRVGRSIRVRNPLLAERAEA